MSDTTNKNSKFTFIIPSYNRYDKLTNLLNQIKSYDNTSVIIFNDASIDKRYEALPSIFDNLTIINNPNNNGKKLYSNTVISLLNSAENTDFDYVVMLADDFILCDNFIELLSGIVNEYDIINIFSIHESNWTYRGWIDGAFACSKNAIVIEFVTTISCGRFRRNSPRNSVVVPPSTKMQPSSGMYCEAICAMRSFCSGFLPWRSGKVNSCEYLLAAIAPPCTRRSNPLR